MSRLPTNLQDAVEGLYSAFAGYPLADQIEASPLVNVENTKARLRAVPLRAISADDLGLFAFKAMTTFGGVNDFRHFLPRIAELLSYQRLVGAADLSLFVRKLAYGQWSTWPASERAAVERWLDALAKAFFDGSLRDVDIDGLWDAAVERDGPSVFMTRWLHSTAPQARFALADAVTDAAQAAQRDRDASGQPPILERAAEVRAALDRAQRETPDPHFRNALLLMQFPPFV